MRSRGAMWTILLGVSLLSGWSYRVQGTYAEQKEKITTLVKSALAGVEGKEAQVQHYECPPGWVGSKHYHPGHVFVYVLEGSIIVDVEGMARRTVGPGEVFHELPNRAMQARNASATDWLKFVAFQIGNEGTPLTVKVE